jgi:hypothetical protein
VGNERVGTSALFIYMYPSLMINRWAPKSFFMNKNPSVPALARGEHYQTVFVFLKNC